jgi:thioesterase domain-containing protein
MVIQPQGPYYIAGWSLGAPVAFEMACQLRDAGQEVAYVGMIDAALPENGRLPGDLSMFRPLWHIFSYPFSQRHPLNYRTFSALARSLGVGLPESLNEIWRRGLFGGCRFSAGILAGAWRSFRVFLANVSGLKHYHPQRFDGDVTLFQTALTGLPSDAENPLAANLRRWARRVQVYDAPGSHMTLVLDHETVTGFAPSFEASLNPYAKRSLHQ